MQKQMQNYQIPVKNLQNLAQLSLSEKMATLSALSERKLFSLYVALRTKFSHAYPANSF